MNIVLNFGIYSQTRALTTQRTMAQNSFHAFKTMSYVFHR